MCSPSAGAAAPSSAGVPAKQDRVAGEAQPTDHRVLALDEQADRPRVLVVDELGRRDSTTPHGTRCAFSRSIASSVVSVAATS